MKQSGKKEIFMRNAGKKSIIGGIVALSLILVGTGYAYWTDTLNVTTKATTGDLDVTFVDLGLYAQYGNEASPNNDFTGYWSIVDGVQHGENDGFVNDLFFARGTTDYDSIAETDPDTIAQYKEEASGYNTVDFNAQLTGSSTLKKDVGPYTTYTKSSDNIVLTVEKMYPGYAQAFRTDIVNQGTIAAKLSNMSFDITKLNGSEALSDTMANMLGIAVYMDKDDGSGQVFDLASALPAPSTFEIGGVTFIRLSALANPDVQSTIANAELLCNPESGKRMDLLLAVGMDPDAEGDYTTGSTTVMADNNDADSQSKGAKISIDFLWDQFNAEAAIAE